MAKQGPARTESQCLAPGPDLPPAQHAARLVICTGAYRLVILGSAGTVARSTPRHLYRRVPACYCKTALCQGSVGTVFKAARAHWQLHAAPLHSEPHTSTQTRARAPPQAQTATATITVTGHHKHSHGQGHTTATGRPSPEPQAIPQPHAPTPKAAPGQVPHRRATFRVRVFESLLTHATPPPPPPQ